MRGCVHLCGHDCDAATLRILCGGRGPHASVIAQKGDSQRWKDVLIAARQHRLRSIAQRE